MTVHDLNDMQRYLVEEEAEKWQEGRITRREFLRRATLIIGSAAAAVSVLSAMGCDTTPAEQATATATIAPSPEPSATTAVAAASPTSAEASATTAPAQGSASPYHVPEDDPLIRAEMVDIPAADGSVDLKGYLATADSPAAMAPLPRGILVIHENRGLTDHIKDVVRRVAKARPGYVALAVDLISREGGTEAHPDEGERTGILGRMTPDQVIADLSAGLDYLKTRNVEKDRLGVTGFCFGGGYAWRMATRRPDIVAAVPFYGAAPPIEDVPNIKAAVLGIYGGNDTRINAGIPTLEEALKQAGVTYEIKIYEGADHAFHNDTGARYHPDAAKDAWEKTLAWFQQHL